MFQHITWPHVLWQVKDSSEAHCRLKLGNPMPQTYQGIMCFGGNTHQIIGLQGLKLVSLYQLTVLTGGSGGTCALQSNQEHYPRTYERGWFERTMNYMGISWKEKIRARSSTNVYIKIKFPVKVHINSCLVDGCWTSEEDLNPQGIYSEYHWM